MADDDAAVECLINIDVPDLAAAERFYCSALGLVVGRRFGSEGVELLGAPCAIYLLQKAAGSRAVVTSDDTRSYKRHWTPVHLDFVVEDIDKAVEDALSVGARIEGPITLHQWGKLALMADPFGNGFCFVEFIGRGYHEIAE